jgi:hypothetical protein
MWKGVDEITCIASTHLRHMFGIELEKLKREGSTDAHVRKQGGAGRGPGARQKREASLKRLLNEGTRAHYRAHRTLE